ncbi:MAG: sel1 repeat family protein, partial [Betaproteobacteria bacterium]|nr:sel1 repeat family protein [Betaproteobacteria bacterium]
DDAEAFRWFLLGAQQGHTEAQFQLANLYALGLGLPESESEPDRAAATWYFEAARQGHAEAQHNLGILFLTGKGVVQSESEARAWFRRAAASGHREARRFVETHPDTR